MTHQGEEHAPFARPVRVTERPDQPCVYAITSDDKVRARCWLKAEADFIAAAINAYVPAQATGERESGVEGQGSRGEDAALVRLLRAAYDADVSAPEVFWSGDHASWFLDWGSGEFSVSAWIYEGGGLAWAALPADKGDDIDSLLAAVRRHDDAVLASLTSDTPPTPSKESASEPATPAPSGSTSEEDRDGWFVVRTMVNLCENGWSASAAEIGRAALRAAPTSGERR